MPDAMRFSRWSGLPGEMILNVAYAGSRGLNLWQPASEVNPRCPTQNSFVPQGCSAITTASPGAPTVWSNATAPRLNPFFSNFALFRTIGVSWYNALQVNLTKHLGRGLQFQTAYTYSKLLDDTEGLANADTIGSTTDFVENPFKDRFSRGHRPTSPVVCPADFGFAILNSMTSPRTYQMAAVVTNRR